MIRRSVGALSASLLLIATIAPAAVRPRRRPARSGPAHVDHSRTSWPSRCVTRTSRRRARSPSRSTASTARSACSSACRMRRPRSSRPADPPRSCRRSGRTAASRPGSSPAPSRLDRSVKVLGRTDRASNVVALRIDASKIKELAKDSGGRRRSARSSTTSWPCPRPSRTSAGRPSRRPASRAPGSRSASSTAGSTTPTRSSAAPARWRPTRPPTGRATSDPKNTTTDGLFPTARVVGGYDFIGESWPGPDPNNPEAEKPDPDPIDFEGHGTHVADIIGGTKGVAPEGQALRPQGLLGGRHRLLRRRPPPGRRLGGRPEPRRQHQGPPRHPQHVARLRLRLGVHRRPVAGRRPGDPGRRADRRRVRQRRRQAVHLGHPGSGPHRPVGRRDAGPERARVPAGGRLAGGDRRAVSEHRDPRLGTARQRLLGRRRLRRAGLPRRERRRPARRRRLPRRPDRARSP